MTGANLQMQSTRQQILEYLQRHGRGTVKELGALLGLTSTGIRQHLTVLERDGLVEAHEERGRVGRPTLVYSLTGKADALFPKTYDLLANVLLEEIRANEGNEKLQKLLRQVAQRLASPYEERMRGKDLGRAREGDGGRPGRAGLPGRLVAGRERRRTSSTSTAARSRRSPRRTGRSARCTWSSSAF